MFHFKLTNFRIFQDYSSDAEIEFEKWGLYTAYCLTINEINMYK